MKNDEVTTGKAKLGQKLTNGVQENKTILRQVCLGGGILLLLFLCVRYIFPGADIYFGFTVFYMLTFFLYVGIKEWARRTKTPYNRIKLGEWLGIAWLIIFILMVSLRFALSIINPELVKERFLIPEEMVWVCGETVILYAISGISKNLHQEKNDRNDFLKGLDY